jgi:AraC-like DNA-binding protein
LISKTKKNKMIWTSLFIISIAQGLFLISILIYRNSKNSHASHLVTAMLAIMIITNFGYLVIRTELLNYIPQAFTVPFGMVLLFGPLFYFYVKSVIDNAFTWKYKYWVHFIPYLLQIIYNLPFFTVEKIYVIEFINTFLAGNLSISGEGKIIFAIQETHLLIYLVFTFRWINSVKNNFRNVQYIIPISSRIKWLKELFYCFSLFALTLLVLYIFVLYKGKYDPLTNYTYTLITSGIIYFISYKLVFNPELVNPDFTQKYRAYMEFEGKDGEKYLQKLKSLMNEEKVFNNPGLKLSLLAEQLGLPSHQVSKLINEKFGKSFNDFVNEYRVKEFIKRLNNAEYRSYTIYGIALDVGFNSKSSFNTAFKKITGKIPSEYKISA